MYHDHMEIITSEEFTASKATRGRGTAPSEVRYNWDEIFNIARTSPVRRVRGEDFDVKVATHLRHAKDAIKERNLGDQLVVFLDTNRRDSAICIGPRELLGDTQSDDDDNS